MSVAIQGSKSLNNAALGEELLDHLQQYAQKAQLLNAFISLPKQ